MTRLGHFFERCDESSWKDLKRPKRLRTIRIIIIAPVTTQPTLTPFWDTAVIVVILDILYHKKGVIVMAKKTNCTVNGKKKYRLRARLPDGSTKNFYGDSKKDAEKKRDEYLSESDTKHIFKDYYLKWLEVIKKPSVANSTFNKYEDKWRVHISKAEFVDKKISDIKSFDIQSFLNSRPSANIAKVCYIQINEFLKYCEKERIITYNPAKNVTVQKDSRPSEKKKYLSRDDAEIVVNAFESGKLDFVYYFALSTGLRLGELLALTIKDVDFNDKVVSVNKSLSFERINGKNTNIIKTPKNRSSARLIPLPDTLIPHLKKHVTTLKEKHLRLGVQFDDDTLLFSNFLCGYHRKDKLTKKWKDEQIKLGVEPVNFHGLRHTFCTMLAYSDVDLKTASVLMGHSNISTTAKIYTHVDDKRKREAINSVSFKRPSGDKVAIK